jgi:hypothetical protein
VLTGTAGRIGRNVAREEAHGALQSLSSPPLLAGAIAALKADDDPDRLLPEDTRPRTAAVGRAGEAVRAVRPARVAAHLPNCEGARTGTTGLSGVPYSGFDLQGVPEEVLGSLSARELRPAFDRASAYLRTQCNIDVHAILSTV